MGSVGLTRLDGFATDGDQFHKPRHGVCPLVRCGRPVVEHPCWRHRVAALIAILAG
ncbi:hypothetical protein ACORG1_13005 [Mycobacterium sp. TJFP1]